MANGENHAKKIVIDEATDLADKLQNGHGADPSTQGKAIGLLVKMITPLYEAEFVTIEGCRAMHDQAAAKTAKTTKIKIGPVEYSGPVSSAVIMNIGPTICCGGMFYAVGRGQGWW